MTTVSQWRFLPSAQRQASLRSLPAVDSDRPSSSNIGGLRRGLGARLGQVAFLLGFVRVPGANNIEAPLLYSPVDQCIPGGWSSMLGPLPCLISFPSGSSLWPTSILIRLTVQSAFKEGPDTM
jgi:hypothetical protein